MVTFMKVLRLNQGSPQNLTHWWESAAITAPCGACCLWLSAYGGSMSNAWCNTSVRAYLSVTKTHPRISAGCIGGLEIGVSFLTPASADFCGKWFLSKVLFLIWFSYLIFDILISRGRRVDILTRTVTCKFRTKKRNADETQQWDGETKFYKRRANKLDSGCQFFRMVLGRSKSFQSHLLSVSVVTHLYRHYWSSLV